ncbi:MAG: protein kinase [Ktedonobacteraceae bacterium]|nr:protein kinase [Ktedonobacteraceae bacterium]
MQFQELQLGHYQIKRHLGSGGMGDVYLAEDLSITRQVAIKLVRMEPFFAADPDAARKALNQFRHEARTIAALNHPHILQLHEYNETELQGNRITYLVMPFCAEGSLDTWLNKRTSPLSLPEALSLLQQAADALQHAHDHGIIHRDVKLQNFLIALGGSPSSPHLLLADFGSSAMLNASTTTTSTISGTPLYMAPEQWNGDSSYTTDQYALAVTAYRLLTGTFPFKGSPPQLMHHHFHSQPLPPSSLQPSLPYSVDHAILKALSKRPEERFTHIQQFVQALTAPPPSYPDKLLLPHSSTVHPSASAPTVSVLPPTPTIFTPAPSKKTRTAIIATLIVLPLLLCIAATSLPELLAALSPQARATATAQVPTATALSQTAIIEKPTHIAQTATAAPTVTAQARISGTATAVAARLSADVDAITYAQATASPPLRSDTLKDIKSSGKQGWDQATSDKASCGFQPDGYHVKQTETNNFHACSSTELRYQNVTVAIDMTILQGHSGGLYLRFDKGFFGDYSGYLFELDTQGNYKISIISGASIDPLQDWDSSDAIKKSSDQQPATNQLLVVACDNVFKLFVNSTPVQQVIDNGNHYPNTGGIALAAVSPSSPTDVLYTNLKVYPSVCPKHH